MSTAELSTNLIEQSPTADRAQAYVALLGMLGFEADPPALGNAVESWALFMVGTDASRQALIAALLPIRERCPVISLLQACVTLNLDISDVMADATC